jgi:hypothetical protein
MNTPFLVRRVRTYALTLVAVAAAFAFAQPASAQFRTSVQGVVTDPQGAVVPGATLTLTDKSTGQKTVHTSDEQGVFNFNALGPDVFTLTAERAGFTKKQLDDLKFIPEQGNALNVQLEIGSSTEGGDS